MTSRQRQHFEALLRGERARLGEIVLQAAVAARAGLEDSDLQTSNRDVDSGTAGMSLADDAAIEARSLAALDDIDQTLQLLSDHPERYGVCEICNRPISAARLEMVPTARRCETHAGADPSEMRTLT